MSKGAGADRGGVFANASGEDEGVDAVEGGSEAKDAFGESVAEDINGEFGAGVAVVGGFEEGAHVVAEAGEAEETAVAIEEVGDLTNVASGLFDEELDEVGVDIAAAGAHGEAFEGGEAHGGVHALAVFDGAGAATVAEVGGDDLEFGEGLIKEGGGLFGDETMAGAVEAVAADLVGFVEVVGQRVEVGVRGHGLMEGGVEHGDVREFREIFHGGADAGDVGGIVQRRESAAGVDFGDGVFIEQDTGGEEFAAVDDAVADAGDGDVTERSKDGGHGFGVIYVGDGLAAERLNLQ